MKDSEKNGGHLLFIRGPSTSVPPSPKPPLLNSFPTRPLDSRWPDLYLVPCTPDTLLGFTALWRFSIHLSLSAAERQAKHFVPDDVVTWRGVWS